MAESKRELAPNETEFLRFVVQAICDAYGGAWSSGALITTVRPLRRRHPVDPLPCAADTCIVLIRPPVRAG